MASADAVLRDYQNNIIDHTPLPLLFNISGKGKPLAKPNRAQKPKRAQKRAVRGVAARQHSNYCTLHRNDPLISDIHTYLAAPCIIPAALPSVNPSVLDPQQVDNGIAQELIASHVWIPGGDIPRGSNSIFCSFLLLPTHSTLGNSDQYTSWRDTTSGILPVPDPFPWFTHSTPVNAPPLMTNAVQPSELGHDMGMVSP
jgi:hypothetical protein